MEKYIWGITEEELQEVGQKLFKRNLTKDELKVVADSFRSEFMDTRIDLPNLVKIALS